MSEVKIKVTPKVLTVKLVALRGLPAAPTQEQINTAVMEYMDDHPEAQIPDGGVTTNKLANGAVTMDKLASDAKALIEETNEISYNAYITETAAGSIASFDDGADNIPVKSMSVAIEPSQEGSGDPSPENVRPIVGWDEVKVYRTGKNRLNVYNVTIGSSSWYVDDGYLCASNKSSDTRSWGIGNSQYFVFLKAGTYTFSVTARTPSSSSSAMFRVFYNGTSLNRVLTNVESDSATFTVNVDQKVGVMAKLYDGEYRMQIEQGSSATEWEEFGETYTIQIGQTVYGGKLDAVKGELLVDKAMILFDGTQAVGVANWRAYAGSSAWLYRRNITPNIEIPEDPTVNISCDSLKPIPYSTSYNGIYGGTVGVSTVPGSGNAWSFAMRVPVEGLTTGALINEWLTNNPVNICYTLAEPITITLDPVSVTTLKGLNNIWSDAGDVDVEYRADTKLYIEKIEDIPDAPSADGTYTLKVTVANGVATYSWV